MPRDRRPVVRGQSWTAIFSSGWISLADHLMGFHGIMWYIGDYVDEASSQNALSS